MSRRGFSLVEVVVAASLLGLLVIGSYDVMVRGFSSGMDLTLREEADVLGRDLLQHLMWIPPEVLEEGLPGDRWYLLDEVDLGIPARLLEARGAGGTVFRPAVAFRERPGDPVTYLLRVEVRWRTRRGQQARLRHAGTLLEGSGLSGPVSGLAGFRARIADPTWGRAEAWTPSAAEEEEGSGEAPPRRSQEPVTTVALAGRAALEASGRPRRAHDGREITYQGGVRIVGDVDAGLALLESNGAPAGTLLESDARLASGLLPPPPRPSGRRLRETRAVRFLARIPSATEHRDQEIPDGRYPFRLELLDERNDSGNGKVKGVYVLSDGPRTHALSTRERWREGRRVRTRVGGEEVLEETVVRDAEGRRFLFQRNEERLVLASLDPRAQGQLELHTLAYFDGSREGTAMTRRAVERFLRGRGLDREETTTGPPTLAGAARRTSRERSALAALSCASGACSIEVAPAPDPRER